jgi:hypothetical protein
LFHRYLRILNEKQGIPFVKYIGKTVTSGLPNRAMLEYDLRQLSEILDIIHDREFGAIVSPSLKEHYLMRDFDNRILETLQTL